MQVTYSAGESAGTVVSFYAGLQLFFVNCASALAKLFFNFLVTLLSINPTFKQVGLSSDPGQGVIIAARDYERQFSAHVVNFKFILFS